jgi:hypothetical protein
MKKLVADHGGQLQRLGKLVRGFSVVYERIGGKDRPRVIK